MNTPYASFLFFLLTLATPSIVLSSPVDDALETLRTANDAHPQRQAYVAFTDHQRNVSNIVYDIKGLISKIEAPEQLNEVAHLFSKFEDEVASVVTSLHILLTGEEAEAGKKAINILLDAILNEQAELATSLSNLKKQISSADETYAKKLSQEPESTEEQSSGKTDRPRKPGPQQTEEDISNDEALAQALAESEAVQPPHEELASDDLINHEEALPQESTSPRPFARPEILDQVAQGAAMQRLINHARPRAGVADYTVIGKACAPQVGLDCGYHASCNAEIIAKIAVGMHALGIAEINWEAIPLLSSEQIRERKQTFLAIFHEHVSRFSAIPGNILDSFMRSNLQTNYPADAPQIYQTTHQPTFFFDALEYMQNKEREMLTSVLDIVAYVSASEENRLKIRNTLRTYTNAFTGNIRFPDEPIAIPETPFTTGTLQNAHGYLVAQRSATHGTYLQALQSFKAGKTLITPWLSHSGNHKGCGHWTCKIFVPKRLGGSATINHVNIINIDSCDSTGMHHIVDDNTERFVFDLLFLNLPNDAQLEILASIFNIADIFRDQ